MKFMVRSIHLDITVWNHLHVLVAFVMPPIVETRQNPHPFSGGNGQKGTLGGGEH
jgi:hypothetical protein